MKHLLAMSSVLVVLSALCAVEPDAQGYVPLFNGRNLDGWVNVNCYPGTFFVKDNEVITTGRPTGYLRTAKQYENFVAEFDWMHVNSKEVGNSGFFVWCDPLPAIGTGYSRGIEVQVLVNLEYRDKKTGAVTATSHGDLFSIWGATCKPDRPHPLGWARCLPSENHAKGGGEWNHYKVTANNGVMKLEVNGKEVSGLSECNPRKGYLALESEGAECHFRNLKIKELPSTNPKPNEIADVDEGFQNLLTGVDLPGWKLDDEARKHWIVNDWQVRYDGKGEALQSKSEYSDAGFIADFRFPKKVGSAKACEFHFRGVKLAVSADGACEIKAPVEAVKFAAKQFRPAGEWNRLRLFVKGNVVALGLNGKPIEAEFAFQDVPKKGDFSVNPNGAMEFGNIYLREIK